MSKVDAWCRPVRAKTGQLVFGGAARNVRIAAAGGMDAIVLRIAKNAAREAFEQADEAVRSSQYRAKLRLVA
ncbi:hypothetical protein [Ferrovum myxofaciens]|uniref:hypothetical protein n=1 Tax=Ferrovum myxofaciens TaxID=416213 RepID=UPI0004E224C8|nr:hypothetical protein [Ferrovum myxofaciens]